MQAELDGKTLAVTRHRRGVMWCPFGARSRQDNGMLQFCDGCNAKFVDEVAGTIVGDVAPRRRGRSSEVADPDPEVAEE